VVLLDLPLDPGVQVGKLGSEPIGRVLLEQVLDQVDQLWRALLELFFI